MLDMKFIRQNPEIVQSIAEQKGITVSIPELLRWDDTRRHSLKEAEELRQTRNQLSKFISKLLRPNVVSPDTPIGCSDADNVEIERVGEPRKIWV